jgi:RNA polymerase sigma factor (sigma-70 family)
MGTRQASEVIRAVRRVALPPDGAAATDGQLLERYVRDRDEDAFAALVRRHGPMVWGVCRRALGHHDAEEAFQAAFLVLARRAAAVVPPEAVADFLHGVAWRTASKARATAARRRRREGQVPGAPEPVAPTPPTEGLSPLLDRELARLPVAYRAAVVLCHLEGKSYREAARQLGCPEGTLSARLTRARQMLARRLGRLGGALPPAALAALRPAAAPGAAVSATVRSGVLVAAGHAVGDVAPAPVAALAEEALRSVSLAKIRATAAMLLLVAVVGVGGLVCRTAAAPPAPAAGKVREAAARQAAAPPEEDRQVWQLDCRFAAPRLLTVHVPGQGNKAVWYFRYHLLNHTGQPRTAVLDFELLADGQTTARRDVVLPGAEEAIRRLEDPADFLRLKNSVTIAAEPVPPSPKEGAPRPVSGVAIWDGVPADAAGLTVFVSGLTNAWSAAGPERPGEAPVIRRKTLVLTFKREGDRMALVGPPRWAYRAAAVRLAEPGPEARGGRGRSDVRSEARGALLEELERQRGPLLAEEVQRRVKLEVVRLRLEALRQTVAEQKPTGAEADRARERLAQLSAEEDRLRTENRERQLYLQLLERRLRELRQEDEVAPRPPGPGEK